MATVSTAYDAKSTSQVFRVSGQHANSQRLRSLLAPALWHTLVICVCCRGVLSPYVYAVVLSVVCRLEFDDVFLVDFFSDSPVTAGWRVLLQLLADYEQVVEAVARYAAALQAYRTQESQAGDSTTDPGARDSSGPAADPAPAKSWEELATSMSAGEMHKLLSSTRHDKFSNAALQKLRDHALDVAGRSELLKTLPSSARLTPSSDDVEQAGWLRPLEFDQQAHRWAGRKVLCDFGRWLLLARLQCADVNVWMRADACDVMIYSSSSRSRHHHQPSLSIWKLAWSAFLTEPFVVCCCCSLLCEELKHL